MNIKISKENKDWLKKSVVNIMIPKNSELKTSARFLKLRLNNDLLKNHACQKEKQSSAELVSNSSIKLNYIQLNAQRKTTNPDNFFSLFNTSPFVIIRFEETKSGSRGGIQIERGREHKKKEGKTETVLEKKQGSC